MQRRSFLQALAAIVALVMVGGPAVAQPQQWVLLGVRQVNVLAEQDTIPVTATEGVFDHIGLRVRGNDLFVINLRVVFGNGDVQDVAIAAFIPQGDETRAIDLAGNNRIINSVVITYRRPLNFRGVTTVEVWGQR